MNCYIADLSVEIPAAGDLVPRCREYLCDENEEAGADIVIRTESFRPDAWKPLTGDDYIYCESGTHFHFQLLKFNGMMLHASCVVVDGKAYLFSAPSGTGKSTHTRLWQQMLGERAKIINDDKPALRLIDGVWYAYGTPWCGKDNINVNEKAPVAGLCFIKQGSKNEIRRLSVKEALFRVLSQTIFRFEHADRADALSKLIEDFLMKVPIYELESLPNGDAAVLSYETMSRQFED